MSEGSFLSEGNETEEPAEAAPVEEKEEKKDEKQDEELAAFAKAKKIRIAAAVLAGIFVLGSGALVVMLGDNKPEEKVIVHEETEEEKVAREAAEKKAKEEAEKNKEKPKSIASNLGSRFKKRVKIVINLTDYGFNFPLAPIAINLHKGETEKIVRLELSIEHKEGEQIVRELKAKEARIRDAIIDSLARYDAHEIAGHDGMSMLTLAFWNRINEFMLTPIEAIYITKIFIE